MNIAFITCFNKTPIFNAIAKKIMGTTVYWISTSEKYMSQLLNEGVNREKILYINLKDAKNTKFSQEDDKYIEDLEFNLGISLNSVYYMDRIIKNWNYEIALNYFKYVILQTREFVLKNNIGIVTSETTAAHEVLISLLCKYEKRIFAAPQTIRMPSTKFAFFEGIDYSKLIPIENEISDKKINEICDDIYKIVTVTKERPFYWKQGNEIPKYNFKYISQCLSKVKEAQEESKTDASVKSLKHQIFVEKKYLKPLRARILKQSNFFVKPNFEEDRFVLITLHKQPEASIDVVGYHYSNQIENIRRIARYVPSIYKIYVKEHSLAFGERNDKFLEKIANIPNVVMVDPYIDTLELMNKAEAVITITGTVAYEAGIKGIKAIMLQNMYFSGLSSVNYIKNEKEIVDILKNDSIVNIDEDKKYIRNNILKYSFDGVVGDSTSKESICEENINNMVFAFNKLIDYAKERVVLDE